MGFEYKDVKINILDTPGHEDFAEDTPPHADGRRQCDHRDRRSQRRRNADPQKLMEVCRMRNTPVMVFINKTRPAVQRSVRPARRDRKELKIKVRPLAWPISTGPTFKGVYDLYGDRLSLFFGADKPVGRRGNARRQTERSGYRQVHRTVHAASARRPGTGRRGLSAVRTGQLPGRNGRAGFLRQRAEQFRRPRVARLFYRHRPVAGKSHTAQRDIDPYEPKLTGFVFKSMRTWT